MRNDRIALQDELCIIFNSIYRIAVEYAPVSQLEDVQNCVRAAWETAVQDALHAAKLGDDGRIGDD